MWHEILITDLTRMKEERVCIGGIDHKGNCIRPVLAYPDTILESHLYINGEVAIRPRAVITLNLEEPRERKLPHSEDYIWIDPNQIECLRLTDEMTWQNVLQRTKSVDAESVFNTPLTKNKYVSPGDGVRSLGTIKAKSIDSVGFYRQEIGSDKRDKFTLNFTDASEQVFKQIPVTDLAFRYYLLDYVRRGWHPRRIRENLEIKLALAEVWLRLGLTRPYRKADNAPTWCYLQITGIYTFPDYLDGRCFADFQPNPSVAQSK
jgi:hypothetical protein